MWWFSQILITTFEFSASTAVRQRRTQRIRPTRSPLLHQCRWFGNVAFGTSTLTPLSSPLSSHSLPSLPSHSFLPLPLLPFHPRSNNIIVLTIIRHVIVRVFYVLRLYWTYQNRPTKFYVEKAIELIFTIRLVYRRDFCNGEIGHTQCFIRTWLICLVSAPTLFTPQYNYNNMLGTINANTFYFI